MTVERLAYVVNARLPTEKAHGLQIAKMCEAFARLGVATTVYSPRRRQRDASLRAQGLGAYYGLRWPVNHVLLPNVDVIPLEAIVPERAFQGVFLAHAFVWAFAAAMRLRRHPADLHFTRDVACAYWLSRFGLPTVLELHAIPRGPQRAVLRSIAKQPGLRALVTLTSFTKTEAVQLGFDLERTTILADGADVERFAAAPGAVECRRRLELPDRAPLIGYVGGFRTIGHEKGLGTLIGALAAVRRRSLLDNAALVCVGGERSQASDYKSLAHRYGLPEDAVIFRTRVPHDEVAQWLRACDVLTIPFPDIPHFSYYASPLKLFEYMAVGGAIVGSDLPAIREVLRNEQNALLVQPSDENALADAIVRFLSEPVLRQRCGKQALRDVVQYSWTARAERLLRAIGAVPGTAISIAAGV